MQLIGWITTAGSIVGVVLNIHRRRACFYVWAVTNAVWCGIDVAAGVYSQATLQAVYFFLAIWGIAKWKTA